MKTQEVATPTLDQFGRDHWSTLLYLESRCVDAGGTVNNDKLRCHFGRHRHMAGPIQIAGQLDGAKYPTTLRDGSTLANHDDWDCVEDLVREDLVVWGGTGIRPVFSLTILGWQLAGRLRRWLAETSRAGKRTYEGFKP